jgi:hypothetical protein
MLRHEVQLKVRTLVLLRDLNPTKLMVTASKQSAYRGGRCVELPEADIRTDVFLQQSKQLLVELQSCILCSGGHILRYNQHITGANIRTCSCYLQQSVCPPSQLYVSMSRANRTVTATASLDKRQF